VPLTHHLSDRGSPVWVFFDERLPNTRAVLAALPAEVRGAVTAPPLLPTVPEGVNYPWPVVGAAVDYRCRYLLGPADPQPLAFRGAQIFGQRHRLLFEEFGWDWAVSEPVAGTVWSELIGRVQMLTRGNTARLNSWQEELLARMTYLLGLFELMYRADFDLEPDIVTALFWYQDLATALDIVPGYVVDDLVAIAGRVISVRHMLKRRDEHWYANPTFSGSWAVGGADADLIAGHRLVELKTTKNPLQMFAKTLRQLVGYTLLDTQDEYQLTEVAVFLPRQGTAITWPIAELLEQLAGAPLSLAQLRREFTPILDELGRRQKRAEDWWDAVERDLVQVEIDFWPPVSGSGKWHARSEAGGPRCGTSVGLASAEPIRPQPRAPIAELDQRLCRKCVDYLRHGSPWEDVENEQPRSQHN
jgi:hypothetical protein